MSAPVPVGAVPRGVAVHPAGTFVYVANSGGPGGRSVSVVSTADHTVVATVPTGRIPAGLGQFVGPVLPGISLGLNQVAFHPGETPVVGHVPVESLGGEIFRHTFSGEEPTGWYRWRAYFTEPATSNTIGLVSEAPFTFAQGR